MDPMTHQHEAGAPIIAAAFDGEEDAARAVEALRTADFAPERIGVASRGTQPETEDEPGEPMDRVEETEEIAEDVATGAVEGGLLGAALGLFVGAFMVPGIGPIVAGGALASAFATAGSAALAGVGLGAATGGVIGVLRGEGVGEHRAARLATELHQGGVLVTVDAAGRVEEAAAILTRNGGRI
jgi:hypothetical protein